MKKTNDVTIEKLQGLVPTDAEVGELRKFEREHPAQFKRIVTGLRKRLTAAGVPAKEIEILLYCYGYRMDNPDGPRTH